MEKNPLIPLAVEKYKQQLCADPTRYHSFASFCRSEHLRSESVSQWMRRHGLTVGMLRAQAMLSIDPDHSAQWLEACTHTRSSHAQARTHSSSSRIPPDKQLCGVSLTFPDGLVVDIRQTSGPALTGFIDSYNKLIDRTHVQPE